ncbi:MAG: thiamine diphosphokinase, partial [Candidatus Marinimicrobia bacterium]|nr:thiamine diphosphokinase [Candidatus Neomarinimicrobiota bacterium]
KPSQHWDRIRKADHLVCTDGAANWMVEEHVTPDVIVGDMDSIQPDIRSQLDMKRIQHLPSQENTDLDKAIQYALDHDFTHATVMAATGKREDQTVANLYLLVKYESRIHLQFLTNYSTIEAITSRYQTTVEPGQTISLLPVGFAHGVTTSGLKYPLDNETLELGSRGVSNQAEDREISVNLESGALLIFRNF